MTTTYTTRTLPRPTFTPREGQTLAVVPAEGPLLRWLTSEDVMGQHPDYAGTYRPTEVTVNRVARHGERSSNVRVTFPAPDLGRDVSTWVHHSFLVDPDAPVVDVETARVAVVSNLMSTTIGDQEWPGAGNPTHWSRGDREAWFAAGNRAVLNARDRIEAGSISAGSVWCAAALQARPFTFTGPTEVFLHDWFVANRDRLTTLMAEAGQNLAAPVASVVRQRSDGYRQDVWMPDGTMGVCLRADEIGRDGTIRIYTRASGDWRNERYDASTLRWAVPGDRLRHDDGREAIYVSNVNDPTFLATLIGGGSVTWERQYVRFAADAAPSVPVTDMTITVGGIEYVRKDVIDRDIETLTGITHRKSVEHSLCGVYDETQRSVDAATEYVKMGARYKDYEVTVEQTLVVRRTFRVDRQVDEAAAIEQARRLARDYEINTVTGRRTGETVRVLRSEPVVTTEATTRVVS